MIVSMLENLSERNQRINLKFGETEEEKCFARDGKHTA